jgi:sugar/nucleoside kinase (ribokinase family)
VFAEDFERFAHMPYEEALATLTGGAKPDASNLGGPAVVSLAHAAQMLGDTARVRFYGVHSGDSSDDAVGDAVSASLARLPLEAVLFPKEGASARTDVLSDPAYHDGHGERTFINLIGSAGEFAPEDITPDFFDADIVTFGGTGLVPRIHDGLTGLLRTASERGAFTMVNLVYDFRSDQSRPGSKWRLGEDDDAYPYIDLLIADSEEALNTSGQDSVENALRWFLAEGVGAAAVTAGAKDFWIAAAGRPCGSGGKAGGGVKKNAWKNCGPRALPVCQAVNEALATHPQRRGDTTGCGDNFAGGFLQGIAEQIALGEEALDLVEAGIPAAASGGFTCFYLGGTWYEKAAGEKRRLLAPYIDAYRKQIEGVS